MKRAPAKGASSLLRAVRASAGAAAHPHLGPVNGPAFEADRLAALGNARSLIGYGRYLGAARDAKARRKSIDPSFERGVAAQARAALGDVEALSGSALRAVGQLNGADFWATAHARMAATLKDRGPMPIAAIWGEIEPQLREPGHKAALEKAGLTDDLAAALREAMSKAEGSVSLRGGTLSVEAKAPGDRNARRLALKPPGRRPAGVLELLGASQFDRVASALAARDGLHLETTGSADGAEIAPGDLFAVAAVAARQRVAEHVRKLEDTGLATYSGRDPTTFVLGLLIAGLVLSLLGAGLLYLCDHPGDVIQPDAVCDVGVVLMFLGLVVLGAAVLATFLTGPGGLLIGTIALVAYGPLYSYMMDHMGFTVSTAPPP